MRSPNLIQSSSAARASNRSIRSLPRRPMSVLFLLLGIHFHSESRDIKCLMTRPRSWGRSGGSAVAIHYERSCFYTATPFRSSSLALCERTVQKDVIQSTVRAGYLSTNRGNCSARKVHSIQYQSNGPVKSQRSSKNIATISLTKRILDFEISRLRMKRNFTMSSTIMLETYTSSYFIQPCTN